MPQVLHDVAARALQIHGSLGASQEMPFGAMVMESFHMGLADGATEVHKVTLAREVLKDYKPTSGLFPTGHLPRLAAAGTQPLRTRCWPTCTARRSELTRGPDLARLAVAERGLRHRGGRRAGAGRPVSLPHRRRRGAPGRPPDRPADALAPDDALAGGTLLGKRYADEPTGLEVLCTKSGAGTITVDGRPAIRRVAPGRCPPRTEPA